MIRSTLFSFAVIATLAGCSGGEATTEPAHDGPAHDEAAGKAPETPETPALDKAALAGDAENTALVPSPVETQRALDAAGISTQLKDLIADKTYAAIDAKDKDRAAVRTGVALADLLLTVKTAEKEALLAKLAMVREGMAALDGGRDIDQTLVDMEERIKADAVTRDELLKEFDELSGAIIPELKFNDNARIVPLIQAGSWLEGANLLARAVKDANQPGAADGLLKQPQVVDYFIKYVKTEGAEKAPEEVTAKLEASLGTLKAVAGKTEALTAEDIESVITATHDVLALL